MKKTFWYGVITMSAFVVMTGEAFAQTTFASLVGTIVSGLLNAVATLFISLAVLAFFYGVVKYIIGLRGGDPNETKKGNEFIIWSLVALFVMFSIYGIITFGQDILFNGRDTSNIIIPDFNSSFRR